MTNEQLSFIEKDLELLKRDNFHPKHADLINIFTKDIQELIKFARKVDKVINFQMFVTTDKYMNGYKDGMEQIKREIYD